MSNKLIHLIVVLVAGFVFSGCGVKYVEMPDLNLKVQNYPTPEEISNLSFALAEPSITIKTGLSSTTHSGLIERLKEDTNKVACYLNDEIHKILISKGFTITSVFQSYDHMTFTQKRNTSALFFPQIVFEIHEKSQLEILQILVYTGKKIRGRLEADVTVNIVMLEPLSGEKIWVKSLPIEEIDEHIEYKPERYGGPDLNGFVVPEDLVFIAETMDKVFEEIGDQVVKATESYVEVSEFEFLNQDIGKLKKIKRY